MSKKTKIQIMSIYGSLLFEYECVDNTIKKTVEKAVNKKVSLYSADLYSADLRSANLYSADLRSANLYSADLRSADLYSADLRSANLYSADLRSANLYSAKFDEPIYISDLYSLKQLPQDTILTYWKYLENGVSPYREATYEVGKTYSEKDCDTNEFEQCGAGFNVATLMWCLKDSWGKSNIDLIEVQFKVSDIVALPYFTDGKFRVKEFKVLRKITREQAVKELKQLTNL